MWLKNQFIIFGLCRFNSSISEIIFSSVFQKINGSFWIYPAVKFEGKNTGQTFKKAKRFYAHSINGIHSIKQCLLIVIYAHYLTFMHNCMALVLVLVLVYHIWRLSKSFIACREPLFVCFFLLMSSILHDIDLKTACFCFLYVVNPPMKLHNYPLFSNLRC